MNTTDAPKINGALITKLLQGVEQSQEGFALCDASGCFSYMNAAHLRMFGYESLSEVLGRPWTVLYDDAGRTEIESNVFPAIAKDGTWSGKIIAKRRDGTSFKEDLTLSMLPDGGIVCNCRDCTLVEELNRELSVVERRFREFSDNLPQGVIIRNAAGVCTYVNHLAAEFAGGLMRNAVGRRLEEVLPEKLRSAFCAPEMHSLAVLTTTRVVSDVHLKEGAVTLEFSAFPVVAFNGVPEAVATIWSDVSVRRRHQLETEALIVRQRELLNMRSEFISLVSHEFRTPLSAIQTSHFLVRKLLGEAPEAKIDRYLTLQAQSIDNLRELVNQVLELNRAESNLGGTIGKMENPALILGELIESINEVARVPRVQSRFDLPADFKMPLDGRLFRAAVENVLTNALKYSPPDSPVHVEVSCRDQELVLTIVDHGLGIPADAQPRLFESFFRGSNVGQISGTGLGLAIVSRALEVHGGRVTFESALNQGTAFHLYFPLVAPTPAQPFADTILIDQS